MMYGQYVACCVSFFIIQAVYLKGFRASVDPRFCDGMPDFIKNSIHLKFKKNVRNVHYIVVHGKIDRWDPQLKSLNSMPDNVVYS